MVRSGAVRERGKQRKQGGLKKKNRMLRRTPLRRKKSLNKISPTKGHKRFIPIEVLEAILYRSNFRCEFIRLGFRCEKNATDSHHIIPRSRGGKHTVENLIRLCREHHRYCHDHPKTARELGYLK